jgi:hypothetical protein
MRTWHLPNLVRWGSRLSLLGAVCLGLLVVLTPPSPSTRVASAHQTIIGPGESPPLPPPWAVPPCEARCVIYGVSSLGPLAGVYAIDVCNQRAANLLAVGGFSNLATDSPDALYLSTIAGAVYRWVIGSPSAPSPVPDTGTLPGGREVALSEGPSGYLYGGTNAGTPLPSLYRRLPAGSAALGPFRFPWGPGFVGDLAFSPTPTQRYPLIGIEPAAGGSNLVDIERSTGFHRHPRPMGAIFHGLAYDQVDHGLWASLLATPNLYSVNPGNGKATLAFGLPVQMEDLASTPVCAEAPPRADLGDAPDSTNHFDEQMTAYPGIRAEFPTVFDPVLGEPQGPLHWNTGDSTLGAQSTYETEADVPPDEDGVTNLDPRHDRADRDGGEDGVVFPISLPQCNLTQVAYQVTISGPAMARYINVWLDFSRNGQWGEQFSCQDPLTGLTFPVREWAVANQPVFQGPGTYWLTTPAFMSVDVGADLWLRVTLSEAEATDADGRGPAGGYEVGETEDYLLHSMAGGVYAP